MVSRSKTAARRRQHDRHRGAACRCAGQAETPTENADCRSARHADLRRLRRSRPGRDDPHVAEAVHGRAPQRNVRQHLAAGRRAGQGAGREQRRAVGRAGSLPRRSRAELRHALRAARLLRRRPEGPRRRHHRRVLHRQLHQRDHRSLTAPTPSPTRARRRRPSRTSSTSTKFPGPARHPHQPAERHPRIPAARQTASAERICTRSMSTARSRSSTRSASVTTFAPNVGALQQAVAAGPGRHVPPGRLAHSCR